MATIYNQDFDGADPQFTALAIRTAFSQGLEILFAFIGAAIQAPWCIPGWITRYRNKELESLIKKIHNYQPIYSILGKGIVFWSDISDIIHSNLVLSDKEKEANIKSSFTTLWSKFATIFLDEQFSQEYNRIKHGMQVKPGGFHLAIGAEETPGIHAPPENMLLIGKSDYGSSYLVASKIVEKRMHFQLKWHSRNWNPEDMLYGLHLISMTLNNIIGFLKIYHGTDPKEVDFQWLSEESAYEEPWKRSHSIGAFSVGMPEYIIPKEIIENSQITVNSIFDFYQQIQDKPS